MDNDQRHCLTSLVPGMLLTVRRPVLAKKRGILGKTMCWIEPPQTVLLVSKKGVGRLTKLYVLHDDQLFELVYSNTLITPSTLEICTMATPTPSP